MPPITKTILVALLYLLPASSQTYTVVTLAGNGTSGTTGDGGPAKSAELFNPADAAADAYGNLYVLAPAGPLRTVSAGGIITTIARLGGQSFAFGQNGNLYVASGSRIYLVTADGSSSVTIAGSDVQGYSGDGGPAVSARLSSPASLTFDSSGNLYFADSFGGNNFIRKISANGIITTAASLAGSVFGYSVAVDSVGNLYYTDPKNYVIRKMAIDGTTRIVAGVLGAQGHSGDGGLATSALLSEPAAIIVDASGNLYFTEYYPLQGGYIRMVTNSGIITTLAGKDAGLKGGFPPSNLGYSGDGGPATSAVVIANSLAFGPNGGLYFAEAGQSVVRELLPVTLTSTPPAISAGGIVPVFSAVPVIQPGSWVSIYGTNLATGTASWNGDFPTSLLGTSVTINGKSAALWFVSAGQINLQAPDDATTGTVNVIVTAPTGTATSTVTLAQFAPSLSLLDSKHVAGIISRFDGSGSNGAGTYDIVGPAGTSLGYKTVPAKAGDTLVLFGVGFGPTNPTVASGKAFSGSAPTTNTVQIIINGTTVLPFYSGITSAGLYQFNLVLPAGLGTGDVTLQATVGGVRSPSGVVISLQ